MASKGSSCVGAALLFSVWSLLMTGTAGAEISSPPATDVKVLPRLPPPPESLKGIAPELLAVLRRYLSFEQPSLTKLDAYQARDLLSTSTAMALILQERGVKPTPVGVEVASAVIAAGPTEGLFLRTYRPMKASGQLPVIIYYHGGGFVFGALNNYDAAAKSLTLKTGAMVVSVAYRLAPEHKFPAAHEDAFATYIWLRLHAAELSGDPERIIVAGESAGGNLALAVALMAKDRGERLPDHVLAVYPITRGSLESPGYEAYDRAVPLSKKMLSWFFANYLRTPIDSYSPWIDLIHAKLKGLPPITILNAEIDPLCADGEELAKNLKLAGVAVTRKVYRGMTHEFFGMYALLPQAAEAQSDAAAAIRAVWKL